MRKILTSFILLIIGSILVACSPSNSQGTFYTVTFDTGLGGTKIPSKEVRNGSKVTKPNDPLRDGFVFEGIWLDGDFEWNFDVDIVTSNLTLVAKWLEVSGVPSNIRMSDEPFSSKLLWQQTDASNDSYKISIKKQGTTNFVEIQGSFEIDDTSVMNLVTFTPDDIPLGGYYDIRIENLSEAVIETNLLFGGAGDEDNPYLVAKLSDFLAILDDSDYHDKHFLQMNEILSTLSRPLEIANNRKISFSGVYDGNGQDISFTGNGGLFHKILTSGVVKNLNILSTTQLNSSENNLYPIGSVSDENHGLIENITSRALLVDPRLQGELAVFTSVDTANHETGAGGIVGKNMATGIVRNVTVSGAGAIKAGRGAGGVSAYNFGLIEYATVTATLPAGNQANSANSSNTYSFGGGITGFNFGTIQYSAVTGRVFAQSAYAPAGNGNEGKNVGFGGIAGYNEGVITESSFARSLAAKEFIDKSRASEFDDAANNLGVASIHGDMYIGGIAGINNGEISSVYVGGAVIGGRDFVGGIAGNTLSNSNIKNAYVFAEVAIKDNGGIKIIAPNEKTTVTTYEIAPSGFDQNTTLYKPLVNLETNNAWHPGDMASPVLPEFTADNLITVGTKFATSGVLLWQQGSVTSIDIIGEQLALPFGSQYEVEFVVLPASAPDIFTTWISSNPDIVEIIGEGLIKAVGEGTATITATTRDGGFSDSIVVTVEDYNRITEVNVISPEITLPTVNTSTDRQEIIVGTVFTLNVEVLPEDAQYKNYSITSSNSRAVVDGNEVTIVYGNTGPGNVSITINFEDSSVTSLEYRFLTKESEEPTDPNDVVITDVIVTAGDFELPNVNDADDRLEVEIGTTITLEINILPENATNNNYTISVSNTRATVTEHTITFLEGSGLGSVSVYIDFEDTTIGRLNYRFTTVEATSEEPEDPETVPIETVEVTAGDFELPNPNDSIDRMDVQIGTSITIEIVFTPENATYQNFTVTVSNSRATVEGNIVTFVEGSGLGAVSVYINFEDPSLGELNYRFTTTQ